MMMWSNLILMEFLLSFSEPQQLNNNKHTTMERILIFILILLILGTALPLTKGKVNIKADNGNYLTLCNHCEPNLTIGAFQSNHLNPLAILDLEVYGTKIALKASNGKYVGLITLDTEIWGLAAAIYLTPTGPALLDVFDYQNGQYSFSSSGWIFYRGYQLTTMNPGQKNLIFPQPADRLQYYFNSFPSYMYPRIGMFFNIQYLFPYGKVTLQSDVGGYVTRCTNCGPGLFPDSASAHESNASNPRSIWTAVKYGGRVAFKADNGMYLARCTNCWTGGFPPDSAFVHVSSTSDPAALWTPYLMPDGRWAFKSDLGRHLAKCVSCVKSALYNHFTFAHVDSPYEGSWANWYVRTR